MGGARGMIARLCWRGVLIAILLAGAAGASRADAEWIAFRSPEHGFAASFPDAPKTDVSGKPGSDPVAVTKFEAFDKSGGLFVVLVYEYGKDGKPPEPTQAVLDKMLQVYGSGSRTKPRNEHMTTIAGHPAIEAIMEDPPGNEYELVDIAVIGGRMYVIISSGGKGHETSPEASRFRDSFQLLD